MIHTSRDIRVVYFISDTDNSLIWPKIYFHSSWLTAKEKSMRLDIAEVSTARLAT